MAKVERRKRRVRSKRIRFSTRLRAELIYVTFRLQQVAVCERCRMVNIDQRTSDNYYKPLSVLAQHQWRGKTVFGIYLKRDNAEKCRVRVGQRCTVIEKCP